jgi:hypothetical protein
MPPLVPRSCGIVAKRDSLGNFAATLSDEALLGCRIGLEFQTLQRYSV